MKISTKPVFETCQVVPSSLLDLRYSQWKSITWQRVTSTGMTARKAFFDHDNKPSQSSIRKGVWILRSLTSLVHTPADANDHTAVGSVPPSFSNMAAPLRDHSEHAYVLATETGRYLRRMLTLGKPSHFSLHSGHSVFFEETHHKARQCRQKLCPQFKVVGLTRMS